MNQNALHFPVPGESTTYIKNKWPRKKKVYCTFLSFKSPLIFVRGTSWTNQSFEVGASCTASLSPEISRFLVSEVRFHNFWKALSSELFRSLDVTQYDSGRLNISFKQDLRRFDEAPPLSFWLSSHPKIINIPDIHWDQKQSSLWSFKPRSHPKA